MSRSRVSEDAQKLLAILAPALPQDTYLAGGTALAILIAHRTSYDLDFTPRQFSEKTVATEMKSLLPELVVSMSHGQTVLGRYRETDLSLFHYPYKLLESTVEYQQIHLASLQDIAAMKVEATAMRGKRRDFFDLYSLCQVKNWPLILPVGFNQDKFGRSGENILHIVKALTYFVDADGESERIDISGETWQAVKEFFLDQTRIVMDEYVVKGRDFQDVIRQYQS